MLLLLVLIVLFGVSTQYRDGFQDDQDDQDDQDQYQDQDDQDDQGSDQEPGMSSLQRKLPPMVSSCVKDGLRQFDDLQ
jgi:hypothetical protein